MWLSHASHSFTCSTTPTPSALVAVASTSPANIAQAFSPCPRHLPLPKAFTHTATARWLCFLLSLIVSIVNPLAGAQNSQRGRKHLFSHSAPLGGVFMAYTRSIRGIFTGYSYVSGMCRECIGYVSGIYRKIRGGKNEKKMRFFSVGALLNVPVFRLSMSISMFIIPNSIQVSMSMWSCVNHPRLL